MKDPADNAVLPEPTLVEIPAPEEVAPDGSASDGSASDGSASDQLAEEETVADEALGEALDEALGEAGDETGDESGDESTAGEDSPTARRRKPKAETPSWDPPPPDRLEGAVEAILLVAGDVVRVERLRDLLGLPSVVPLHAALAAIEARWTAAGLAFELERVGGGVRVVTRPEYAEYVGRLSRKPASDRLSRAQLETLCIVAYQQPVGRAEVERIRGVQAGDALRQLLERRLLKVLGRSDLPGRPLLYGTTQGFLTAFGLDELGDLPQPQDLKRM
ncbi:MAG: SMC-Scp complex subunit ScpB [Planctomycetota bacterium]|nr:SMC-Scp complex subunit ScpB [Planctomycetota bacterium]